MVTHSSDASIVETTALLLREGDVIVAPDSSEHTVTSHYQVDGISVSFSTNTGLHLHKTWFEAKSDTYQVRKETQ